MIHGSMSMGTAGIVCIVSMLIVFAVMMAAAFAALFVVLMGKKKYEA